MEYRREDDDNAFDTARAFCTVTETFVQPMRADICNDRYELDHATDCEIFRERADSTDVGDTAGDQL
jgi:hypothetical protein